MSCISGASWITRANKEHVLARQRRTFSTDFKVRVVGLGGVLEEIAQELQITWEKPGDEIALEF